MFGWATIAGTDAHRRRVTAVTMDSRPIRASAPLIDHTPTLYPCWSLPGRSGRRFTAREPDLVDRHLRPSEGPSQLGRPRRHHPPRTAPRRRQLTRRQAVSPGHPTPFGGSIPCGYSCPTDYAPGSYLPSRSHSPARSSAAPPPPPAAATPTVRPRAGYDAPTAHSLDTRDVGANQPISIIRLCGGAGYRLRPSVPG